MRFVLAYQCKLYRRSQPDAALNLHLDCIDQHGFQIRQTQRLLAISRQRKGVYWMPSI